MSIKNLGEFSDHPTFHENPRLLSVLKIFDGISNHPRPSKGEAAVRQHLIEVAQEQGWNVEQDDRGNIAIQVPASLGKEEITPVILQGHMDIVVTPKDKDLPRTAEIVDRGSSGDEKGLWMQTEGKIMTLGADNGIGVSLAMAAMMDPELEHGPVTILITVDEETGMTGAKGLDPRLLPEKAILVNLDSEEGPEGICIGCAGSTDIVAQFTIGDRENIPEGYECLELTLNGLPGGHSGIEIHTANGNAIQSLATLLNRIQSADVDLRLISINGGTARNAIPNEATAHIAVPMDSRDQLRGVVDEFVAELKVGQPIENPAITGVLSADNARNVQVNLSTLDAQAVGAFAQEFQQRLLSAIEGTPTGPFASAELPNVGELVTLSNNLGRVDMHDNIIDVISMARGANIGTLRAKMTEIAEWHRTKGGEVQCGEPSAGWLEDPSTSPAVKAAVSAVDEVMGESRFLAYHAGLESGIITDRGNGLSAVSIGPLIKEAHTPRERVSLDSVSVEIKVLRRLLEKI